jgi:hypothetical protein
MSSHNWKNLERTAAKKLGGQRLTRGADFSQSIPDIRLGYAPKVVVDCKYSINTFSHHKHFLKSLAEANKANKKPARHAIDDHTLMIPAEKKSSIRSLIGEAESKYGKPVIIVSRNKGQEMILCSIREDFYQELLMGSKMDDGVFIVVVTIEHLRKLLEGRYGVIPDVPTLANLEPPVGGVGNTEAAISWEEWE